GMGSGSQLDGPDVAVSGPLGAQFLCWEVATAHAGRLIGIDPFNQPNVTESKNNTKAILESGAAAEEPAFTEGAVTAYGTDATTVTDALRGLVSRLGEHGYLA